MARNIVWLITEMFIWYSFFYTILYAIKNPINIGWSALVILLFASFGFFASPITRHLSFWNKILDKVVKREEERMRY